MSGVLIFSDKEKLAREACTAANVIAQGGPVKMVVCKDSFAAPPVADAYVIDAAISDTACLATAIAEAAKHLECNTILLSADRRGKELSGRVAQKLDAGVLAGVTAFDVEGGEVVASYPSLGGAVVNRAVIATENKVFTVAANCFDPADEGQFVCETLDVDAGTPSVVLEGTREKEGSSVDITAADVLVIVGCGVEDESAMEDIEGFAKALGGDVACTKPVATDRKWLSEDLIVGISGKTCKPRLAVTLGVSGQVQFWAGVRDADTVVALNTDENAYIVGLADASVICDAMEGMKAFEACL